MKGTTHDASEDVRGKESWAIFIEILVIFLKGRKRHSKMMKNENLCCGKTIALDKENIRMTPGDGMGICYMDGPQRSVNQAETNASMVDEMSFKLRNTRGN